MVVILLKVQFLMQIIIIIMIVIIMLHVYHGNSESGDL